MGTNRYAYSDNDPINKSDPSGHARTDPGSAKDRDAAAAQMDGMRDPAGGGQFALCGVCAARAASAAIFGKTIVEKSTATKEDDLYTPDSIYNSTYNEVRKDISKTKQLDKGKEQEAHHIVQDTRVDHLRGYSKSKAPAIALSPDDHKKATNDQRAFNSPINNLETEMQRAKIALDVTSLTPKEKERALEDAKNYFLR